MIIYRSIDTDSTKDHQINVSYVNVIYREIAELLNSETKFSAKWKISMPFYPWQNFELGLQRVLENECVRPIDGRPTFATWPVCENYLTFINDMNLENWWAL